MTPVAIPVATAVGETVVLAHPADEPAVLIGGPVVLLLIFTFFEWRARRRERDSDEQ